MLPHPKRVQVYSFLFVLLVALVLIFFLLRPFFDILAVSFILAVLFRPLYDWLQKYLKFSSLSAFVSLLIMLAALLLPLWIMGQMLFNEAADVYVNVRESSASWSQSELIQKLPIQAQAWVTTISGDLNQLLGNFTANAFQVFSSVLSNLAHFVLAFFLVLFTVFYWLKDGHHIKQVLMDLSPIANSQERVLFNRISASVNGVVKGTFLVALVQGLVAGMGFWIFGVPNPALWAGFTVLAALVPNVGTALSVIPAILYLVVVGQMGDALGLTIWGILAVGLIDNFLGPKIVGRAARVHPVLVLFSILGGVSIFGFIGFLLGPIIMAIFVAMVDMYRTDFQEYLEN